LDIQTQRIVVKVVRPHQQVPQAIAVGVGIEGCEFEVHALSRLPRRPQAGDCIEGYVLHDEQRDEFYLEATRFASEGEYRAQEAS